MTVRIPTDSKEWLGPVTVTVNGLAVTTGIELALVRYGDDTDEGDWTDPTLLDGGIGYLLDPVGTPRQGTYVLRARVTDNPEIPTLNVGTVIIA